MAINPKITSALKTFSGKPLGVMSKALGVASVASVVYDAHVNAVERAKYTDNLEFISLFTKIMEVSNKQENFKFKTTYNTTNGIIWDEDTTQKYVDMMLSYSDDL